MTAFLCNSEIVMYYLLSQERSLMYQFPNNLWLPWKWLETVVAIWGLYPYSGICTSRISGFMQWT